MRKVLSLALALIMVLSLTIVAVGAADTNTGKLKVTVKDLKGGSVTQTYKVGETFTVWTSLNAKNINGGKMGSINAEQIYDSKALQLADAYNKDGLISDLDAMFPVTGDVTIANGKKVGGIYYNASTPSYSGFLFNSSKSYVIVAHYKVIAAGETTIENNAATLAIADFSLTRIIDRGVIKNSDFTSKCTLSDPAPVTGGSTLSGQVKSFVTTEKKGNYAATVELLQGKTVIKTATYDSSATFNYSFSDVADGDYTLRFSKKNHVTRSYKVTVSGDTTKNAQINPLGDVDGDGAVNNFDYGRVNSHARNRSKITDSYLLKCADIDGDGAVNNFDAGRINSMAKKKSSFWT